MPDLQIFIISPPDNLIMQRTRIHFAPPRKPARAALSSDYFPALAAALYKPTRTPSIMLLSPRLLGPLSAGSEAALLLLSGLECAHKDPKRGGGAGGGWPRTPCSHARPLSPALGIPVPAPHISFSFCFPFVCFKDKLPEVPLLAGVCYRHAPSLLMSSDECRAFRHPEWNFKAVFSSPGPVSWLLWVWWLFEFLLFSES